MSVRIASFVKIKNGRTKAVLEKFQSLPEAVRILCIIGEYDVIVEFEAATPEALNDVLVNAVDAIPGITDLRSHFVTARWEK